MIQRQLSNIHAKDLDDLLKEPVREDRTTEYKSILRLDSDPLMKAVSSFANSIGGDLIFGIEAKDGIPRGAPGVDRDALDKGMLRLMELSQRSVTAART